MMESKCSHCEAQENPALEFREVSYSYGGPQVLQDISLALPYRQLLSIVGPNGGGKTTLLKLALGLLKPQRGSVRVMGLTPEEARSKVGYVPQHFHFDPLFPATVLDVVELGCLTSGWKPWELNRKTKQAAKLALESVELSHLSGQLFGRLSGGQRQRVLVARALASGPELLLLDEPTANVDLIAQREMHSLLVSLAKTLTVVLVTHDMSLVASTVGWVVCVNRKVDLHPTQPFAGGDAPDAYSGQVRMVLHDRHLHGSGVAEHLRMQEKQ